MSPPCRPGGVIDTPFRPHPEIRSLPAATTDGVLSFSNDEVRDVFDMSTCVALLENGFRGLGEGAAVNPPRVDRSVRRDPDAFDGATDPTYYRLKTMTGASTEAGMIRVNSDMCHWPTEHGTTQKEKLRATDDDQYVGFVLLFDPDTTAPEKYERAVETGLGTELPTGIFTQDLTP